MSAGSTEGAEKNDLIEQARCVSLSTCQILTHAADGDIGMSLAGFVAGALLSAAADTFATVDELHDELREIDDVDDLLGGDA